MEKNNNFINNKIAIIHDSFTNFGGAERVLLYLIKMFPQADIYTSLIKDNFCKKIKKKSKGKLYFSKLSKLPFAIKHPSFFKPYFFHYFWEKLDLNKYDLVISSSHSFCSHFVKVKNKHLSYMYTTPRFLHNEFNEITWVKKPFVKIITEPYFKILRRKNLQKIKKIDTLIADSINVQKRIKKYYNAQSSVIYPPVKLAKKIIKTKGCTKYYLFFSRLVKQKGIELVIETFNKNKKPLIVVGSSNQEKKWKKISNKNIKFMGFVTDKKIPEIFSKTKALIYASINEDFGMVPVEAMSHGVPVIAYKSGGVKESIINKKTGLFFEKYNEKCLNQAIDQFEKTKIKIKDSIDRAMYFNENKFKKKMLTACKKQLDLINN